MSGYFLLEHPVAASAVVAGESSRRALQLWRWMYYDDCWMQRLEDTIGKQNGFSKAFCEKASSICSIDGGLQLQQVAKAQDGTTKLVFQLTEGEGKGMRGRKAHGTAVADR